MFHTAHISTVVSAIAEQCGYIAPIGQQVAISISAVELRSNNFVDHVREILQETGLGPAYPAYLVFELTTNLPGYWAPTAGQSAAPTRDFARASGIGPPHARG